MKRKLIVVLALGGMAVGIKTRMDAVKVAPPAKPGAHVILDQDVSPSMALGCDAIVAVAEKAIELIEPDIREGSTLSVIYTGGKDSSYEPRLQAVLPINASAGPFGGGQRQRKQLLEKVSAVCERVSDRPDFSPVYRSIVVALQHAHSLGCGQLETRCALYVMSDGLDNVDRKVTRYLLNPAGPKPDALLTDGIATTWCGYEEVGPGAPRPTHKLMEAWRTLFTQPPNMQPFCQGANVQARREE